MNKYSKGDRPLARAVELFQALNDQGIRHCHWKSNWNLDQSMRGLTDLDLLVDRSQALRFRGILCQQDFKQVLSEPFKQHPAMEDYLGFDRDSGRFVHLHVHYQLILGEQFVKNYHLPLEQAFLDSSDSYGGIKLPPPELETIVLVIRALLKYRDRDFIKDILSAGRRGLPADILKEFEYLLNQTTLESISSTLESQVDFVSCDIVLEFLAIIKAKRRPAFALYRLRRSLLNELRPYQRYSRWRAVIRYFRVGLAPRCLLSFGRSSSSKKKTMMSGGLTIAVVGADGAGKSTVVRELRNWLSWRLTVRTYYMGSQDPSTMTKAIGWGSRVTGYAYRACCVFMGERNARFLSGLSRLFRSLHLIAIGMDRHNRYIAGRRNASQGSLVICDRYPLEAARMGSRFMDGPRIASTHPREMGQLATALSQAEESIYRRIRPPDHLVILHVSPHVSAQRKPDDAQEMLESKCQALKRIEGKGLHVTDIDANQPLDQVLLQVKSAVWDLL